MEPDSQRGTRWCGVMSYDRTRCGVQIAMPHDVICFFDCFCFFDCSFDCFFDRRLVHVLTLLSNKLILTRCMSQHHHGRASAMLLSKILPSPTRGTDGRKTNEAVPWIRWIERNEYASRRAGQASLSIASKGMSSLILYTISNLCL